MRGLPLVLAAGVALLATPAGAAAATLTVDPAAPAGCDAAGLCKTITAANARALDGDTISIKAGTYAEPTITVLKRDLAFVAADPGKVTVSTSAADAGAATFILGDGTGPAASGTVLRGLVVGVPATGGPAVVVRTRGTLIEGSVLQRVGATADVPALLVDDAGSGVTSGTNTVRGSFVVQFAAPAEAGAAPAVQGGTRTSLVLEDTAVFSGDRSGPGVALPGNDRQSVTPNPPIPNRILRGQIVALNPAANAVEVTSGATSSVPKALQLDSVVLSPGAQAAGLRAASLAGNALTGSTAGDITVAARRVTVAGGGRPFALSAMALGMANPITPSAARGSIAVEVDRAIAHGAGPSTVATAAASLGTTAPTATIALRDSDLTDAAGPGIAVSGATTRTPDAQLFRSLVNRDLHLRADAPVIDQAGAPGAGESDKDFEGQPRVTGAAADTGADEYANTLPTATLKADKARAAQGEVVTFDASGSADPDGTSGTGVTRYLFDFGDGTPLVDGSSPTATHAYAQPGAYAAKVLVVDAGGGLGFASVEVAVVDALAPTVTFSSPKAGQRIRLFTVKRSVRGRRTTTRTTLRKVRFTGRATDAGGVAGVELALRRVKAARGKSPKVGTVVATRRTGARATQAGRCTFLDPKAKRFSSRPCATPVFFPVAVKDGAFVFQLRRGIAYRLGTYELIARARDRAGNLAAPVRLPVTLR